MQHHFSALQFGDGNGRWAAMSCPTASGAAMCQGAGTSQRTAMPCQVATMLPFPAAEMRSCPSYTGMCQEIGMPQAAAMPGQDASPIATLPFIDQVTPNSAKSDFAPSLEPKTSKAIEPPLMTKVPKSTVVVFTSEPPLLSQVTPDLAKFDPGSSVVPNTSKGTWNSTRPGKHRRQIRRQPLRPQISPTWSSFFPFSRPNEVNMAAPWPMCI